MSEETTQEKPEGYVFGRPTAYKPEYCQMLIDHCAEGYSFESFAGRINVCSNTLTNWCKDYPDFFRAKNQAKQKMLFIDEQTLNYGAKGLIENYNAASQIFKMKAVHKWSDKQEIDLSSVNKNTNLNVDVDWTKLTDEELELISKLISKTGAKVD